MKYALIDMGSNSIRLTVYDLDKNSFKILFKEKIMAGLAGYVEMGSLTHSVISCVEVEVLSGEAEAECGFFGAACDVEMADGLFADIGGASTELALLTGGQLQKAGSVPVGSLKLYRDCVKKILPGKGSQQRIMAAVQAAFDGGSLKDIPPMERLVCVGGTARAALRLCKSLFGLPENSRSFTRAQLELLAEQLCKADKDAADLILRYEPERIHTLIPGLMLLRYMLERYQVSQVTVSHYGVREGYLRRRIQPAL